MQNPKDLLLHFIYITSSTSTAKLFSLSVCVTLSSNIGKQAQSVTIDMKKIVETELEFQDSMTTHLSFFI